MKVMVMKSIMGKKILEKASSYNVCRIQKKARQLNVALSNVTNYFENWIQRNEAIKLD